MRRLLIACLTLAACATEKPAQKLEPANTSANTTTTVEAPKAVGDPSKPMPPGLDESAMNARADPCKDFYEYACGTWMVKTEIPADKPLYSRSFVRIYEQNELKLREILDEAVANTLPKETPFAKQLGDYYGTCMDEAALEKALPEVKAFAAKYSAPKNAKELAKAVGELQAQGVSPFFNASSMQDLKDSSQVVLSLDQGGLGLPDRDYYLKTDEKTKAVRDAYAAHVEKMFVLWGEKPEAAKKASETVMVLESRLATVSQTIVERREPQNLYNRVDRKGLKEKAPDFQWDAYLAALGGKDLQAINVNSVPYFSELSKLAKENKAAELKTYFTWVIMRWAVPMLPRAFADEQFAYTSKALTGAKEDRPRWKKCVAWTDGDLGEAVGREFVRRHFGDEGKKLTNAMVLELQKSFEKNLGSLAWMDAPTRAAALAKVQRMAGNNKIGYPDKWRDYSSVKTDRKSFFANQLAANRFALKRELDKVGKPPDRTEWLMSPPTVNAYNEPQKNEIVFPAGILQPPFFDRAASDAVNFGAMGMVVGHEITHGFDDEGRKYDVDGNVKDWWTEASGKAFEARVACVEEQFNGYTALEDVKLNGKLTLGENVADLGGLKLAYSAMQDWYKQKGGSPEYRYTPPQQFFLGYAQAWCTKVRPETARMRAAVDPHAPPYWRVNGPLANLASFQEAFSCKADAAMVKPKRCDVW